MLFRLLHPLAKEDNNSAADSAHEKPHYILPLNTHLSLRDVEEHRAERTLRFRRPSFRAIALLSVILIVSAFQLAMIGHSLNTSLSDLHWMNSAPGPLQSEPFRQRPGTRPSGALKHHPSTDSVQWFVWFNIIVSASSTNNSVRDNNILYVRNQPTFIISGEFHYWRMPSQHMYLDIFQKMRAMGLNSVSLTFNWGYHHLQEDKLVFVGVGRDIQALLDSAKRAGLYVIVRPG